MTTRYLARFESTDGALVVTFGLNAYRWESDQAFRLALSPAAGADWAYDPAGKGRAPLDVAVERVSYLVRAATEAALETALAELRSRIARIGLGYLIRRDSDGTERRAFARPATMPVISRVPGSQVAQPVVLEFRRLSHWMATTATTGSTTVTSTPHTWTISNPGDLPCDAVVFRLRSNSAGPTTDPKLENLTNGYWWATTRDLTHAYHEIRIDTGRWAVEWSTNDGASYSNDWALASIGATQVGIMRLEPGSNSMRATVASGTPSYTLEWSFYARYA
jgi:hypothetical protein